MTNFVKIDNKKIYTPVERIVQDVQFRIHNGKLKNIRNRGDNLRVTCPFHNGGHENRPSADVYIGKSSEAVEYGWFRCFTCGKSVPFFKFVASCMEISEESAKSWLLETYEAEEDDDQEAIDLPEIDLTRKKGEYLDESILERFESFHPYMIQRKLSRKIIDLFQIKYDPKSCCLVFPIRDKYGRLKLLVRRHVDNKVFLIDKNKEKPLYLLDYMIKNNIDQFMITEGPIDALTACSYGFPCVATLGSVSRSQIDDLNNSGVRVLYLGFDNDAAGKSFAQRVLQNLRKDILVVQVNINVPGCKDINDLSEEQFWQCLHEAEEV